MLSRAQGIVEKLGGTWAEGFPDKPKGMHSRTYWQLAREYQDALNESDGHTPAVAGFFDKVKPLTRAQIKMIQDAATHHSEATVKKQLGVEHWVHDSNWLDSLVLLESRPTINIEGLVAGYTGPGGKTVLPHRAVAKIDMRLVPATTKSAYPR